MLGEYGSFLQSQGRYADTIPLHREEVELRKKMPGDNQLFVNIALSKLASALGYAGSAPEAERLQRTVLVYARGHFAAEDPQLGMLLSHFTFTLLVQQKFAEAESAARESSTILEKKLPDDWRLFNACSQLGGSLLGQRKYKEAEPLLLSGYEGMKQRATNMPPAGTLRLREAVERLAELHEVIGQTQLAAQWKNKLAEFDSSKAGKP